MNDIAKNRIAERLQEAMELEKLTKTTVTDLFGFKHPNYISWASKVKNRNKCPKAVWLTLQEWTNSGLSIKEFTTKLMAKQAAPTEPEPRPETTSRNIKADRIFDSIRMSGEIITKDDVWFNSIIWCIDRARERGIDLRVTITKLENR